MLQRILSLPIEEKIGQLFFMGLPSPELDDRSLELINKIKPGGICLFARNVRTAEQVRNLLDSITENIEIQPFLSLDQEGGLVDRLRRISTPMPGANLIQNKNESAQLAEITAELIRILGFNMNFAPVVDVVDEERSKFSNGLFSRAFGKTKEEVTELAGKYLEVLQEKGCIGTLKHFPGIGASEIDSHEDLPAVKISQEILFEKDLFPYKELSKTNKIYAIMIGHTAFPNIDLQETDQNGKLLPSSLSYNFITKLLRQELGFEGITITDDLEMGAIVNNYGIGEACKMAFKAGNDMLAICAGVDSLNEGFLAISKAFETGEFTEPQIDESLNRIAEVKTLLSQPLPFELQRIQELSEEISKLNNQLKQNNGG
jgi:beta-N-acetylhexosaminidase